MTNVMAEIKSWAKTLKYWEQAILNKIIAGEPFTDDTYQELYHYLLEDEGLIEKKSTRPQLQSLSAQDIPQEPSGQIRLAKISNLKGVNALAPNQTLTFGPALTAIFGANASGKSGYARVLGCAGFTRGDKEVLPDVTKPATPESTPSADVEICYEDGERSFCYEVGSQCPELASFHVFDATSVTVHLTASNEFSFSPAGLNYLTELAKQTDKVRECLKEKAKEFEQPHDFSPLFQAGKSEVTEIIENLGPNTDLKLLKRIAKLSEDEKTQIKKLDKKIAELKSKDIPVQIKEVSQKKNDLETLTKRLRETRDSLSDEIKQDITGGIDSYVKAEKAAKQLSVDRFKTDYFTQTGTDIWQKFIESAKALADVEGTPEKRYPQPGDRCLLCHQTLSVEARDLLLRLWEFLEGEARDKLESAQTSLNNLKETLDGLDLDFFDEESVYYRDLNERKPKLSEQVKTFMAASRKWCKTALKGISEHKLESLTMLPNAGISEIEKIIKALNNELADLQKKNPEKEINELEGKLLNLRHREILNQHLSKIEEYVLRRILWQAILKIGGTTRHITLKYNDLFSKLVTKGYLELFEKNLSILKRPINIKMETIPRKGMTYRQIGLRTDPNNPVEEAATEKVLSEGEKRAVALSDFLTEVELDPSSNGVILDDPVTSLDLEWRETIAAILAGDSKRRQVIVFTHDLPFLYHLKKHAEKENIDMQKHWIQTGEDGKPGYVYLENSPALEKDYTKTNRVRDVYKQAKDSQPQVQEAILKQGFGQLRACYEAFIIYDLFGGVVQRFEEQVRYKLLREVIWDESLTKEVMEKYEFLPRFIEGHLHSDEYAALKSSPELLLSEIDSFEALKKRLKELKKRRKAA